MAWRAARRSRGLGRAEDEADEEEDDARAEDEEEAAMAPRKRRAGGGVSENTMKGMVAAIDERGIDWRGSDKAASTAPFAARD
jgi:hypothetical protein